VDLDLREQVTREQVAALHHGEIDLGLARPPFDADTFGSRLLHREALLVVLPTGHPLAALGRPLTAEDLVNESVIMHSPTSARYFYDLVVSSVIMHSPTSARYFYDLVVSLVPIPPQNVVHTVSQILTMVWLVAAGRGLAFVPASAARLGVPGVEFAELATPVRQLAELHLLWGRDSRNPALWRVLDALKGLTID
jgi:DNA-binding transcriptional LysR family regulator